MQQFASQIFMDGGDPAETREADQLLRKAGYPGIQGQTTNPSLIIKNAKLKMKSEKITEKKALKFWRKTVEEMAAVTKGPISIQVVGWKKSKAYMDVTGITELIEKKGINAQTIPIIVHICETVKFEDVIVPGSIEDLAIRSAEAYWQYWRYLKNREAKNK